MIQLFRLKVYVEMEDISATRKIYVHIFKKILE